MGPLNEWQNLELGHFEVGNFCKKKTRFLTTGGARAPFKGQTKAQTISYVIVKKTSDMWYPLPPMTHQMSKIEKSGNFSS